MAPAPATKNIPIVLEAVNQVTNCVSQLPYNEGFDERDVVEISVTTAPKARIEIATVSAIIQFSCNLVLSKAVYDVRIEFPRMKLPFAWTNRSIRDVLYAPNDNPIALEVVSDDCRLTVFKNNDDACRDEWYDAIKHWHTNLPPRFHLLLNELVENVSAHAQLPEDRFCFTVGLHFYKKKLCYCVADCGVGLHGSLQQGIVEDAKAAARRACALYLTRPQVTSKGIERGHQGVGLFITSELSQMNKGYVQILSGLQEYEQRDTTVVRVRGIAEWKGTMVHGAINLDQEFNYRRAMKLFSNPNDLNNDRFLVASVHLNVYGQKNLRTRELCEEIIRDLEAAVERSTKIILDFTDIEEISQAFSGFLRRFVTNHSKVRMMIMIPPNANEDLREDLQDLSDLAAQNKSDDEE
ncbi:9813_t:CDS:2 [Paraglomus brasilianum]|uniref:9813_t:CDS:1 n=1 Tax=Paraglomus brasilianum TaxID=144538 RepID=A0A9N8ZS04_9GLOM|nr:9813_t:CDS:2 [Paraglomus brasilianum]